MSLDPINPLVEQTASETDGPPLGHNLPYAVEMVPTSALSVPDSTRIFSPSDRRQLRRIGKRFFGRAGVEQTLVVDDQNHVIIGEALLIAAREAGVTEVPVTRIKAIGALEAKALSIAYARLGELGENDQAKIGQIMLECEVKLGYDVTDFGFEVAEIDLMVEAANEDVPEQPIVLQKQVVSLLGDIWILGQHRIIHGDALDPRNYEALLEGEKGWAVFADPPYGCAIDGFVAAKGRHREFVMGSGDMNAEELRRFFVGFNQAMVKHLAPGAVIYECIDFRGLHILLDATRDIFGPLVNLAVWTKDRPGQGAFLRSQHELVLILKTKGRKRNNVMLGKYGRSRSNVWAYPSAVSASKASDEGNLLAEHPTPKPVRLVADALLDTTRRGDIVIDPFSGSGTTIIACEKTGRRVRAVELDAAYVDLAIRRWQAWSGGQAMHAETGETFDEREARVTSTAVSAE